MSNLDRMRDEQGELIPDQVRLWSRNMQLTNRENGTASDDVIELAEIVVPEMAETIARLEQEVDSREADAIVDHVKTDKMRKVERALQILRILVKDDKVVFEIHTGKDPVIINAKVPPEDWMKLPELSEHVSRLNEIIS